MGIKHRKTFVFMLERHNDIYWLKKRGEDKRNLLNRLINGYLQTKKNLAHLVLHSGLSPRERFSKELESLEYVLDHELPGPQVVATGKSFFITESAGIPIKDRPANEQHRLFLNAARVLIRFHRAGVIHGRPAMRDIVANDAGEITFLDFEEARISDCPILRSRDMLLFLMDSYRLKRVSQQTRLMVLSAWLNEFGSDPQRIVRIVKNVIERLIWLPKLILSVRNNRLSKQILLLDRLLKRYEKSIRQGIHITDVALD